MIKQMTLWVSLLGIVAVTAHANIITNPDGMTTPINSNNLVMQQEVGNTSLTNFNQLSLRYTFTFDGHHGYPLANAGNPASRVDRIELTAGVSGIEMRADLSSTGFRLTSNYRPTGSTNDLVLQSGSSLTVLFTNGVQGVAFTANRILATNLTVRLYSDRALTTQIGSDFIMNANSGGAMSERSFFGYYDGAANIEGLRIVGTGAQQYSIDDLSVAMIPEPSVLAQLMMGLGMIALFLQRRITQRIG